MLLESLSYSVSSSKSLIFAVVPERMLFSVDVARDEAESGPSSKLPLNSSQQFQEAVLEIPRTLRYPERRDPHDDEFLYSSFSICDNFLCIFFIDRTVRSVLETLPVINKTRWLRQLSLSKSKPHSQQVHTT